MSTPTLGIFLPLTAKPDQAAALGQFLLAGYDILAPGVEPDTLQWFAVKYASGAEPVYAIFDTFAAEPGRQAHFAGPVAAALQANADALLAKAPDFAHAPCDVLASLVRAAPAPGAVAKGLQSGLRVLVRAKPEKVDAVREFLKGALPLVEAEPLTAAWYAIEFPGTGAFGIVDFFPSQEGLDAHLKGEVAKALFANADALLTQAPDVMTLEVVAALV
ncbi:uncharacterized protein BXZ73DRAFT_99853 [Epithele typhae]|uniref:uncharacterized protein n=1 Tax=Epithele typhae TaxID=378194 RepID=UPI0020084B03|nr:uncharacterized protein BXZ73DRAFT_99853 [Epithele typhae]KAH9938792.1 hypothetical protein BXZ73DRAFT_99853 [Epithele typhae]